MDGRRAFIIVDKLFIDRRLHNTVAVLNSTGTSGYEKKNVWELFKISEHYEVDMNTHVLNYMVAYTYRLIHTHTPDFALFSHFLSFLFSYCLELFYN
jgi:hypothetical protein